MEKDQEKLYALIISQLLHDGFTESAQHLATSLVSLSTVTQCVSSNQLLEIYKSQCEEQEKAPIILMIEDESGKTTQLEVPGSLQIDDQGESLQEAKEEIMTTEEPSVTMVSSEDSDVCTTTAVATGDQYRHGDSLYVGEVTSSEDKKLMEIVQPVDSSYITNEVMERPLKRKRTDDDVEILDGFGEFGPSDPSEDDDSEGENKVSKECSSSNIKETNCFERSTDGYTCSMCNTKYNMEIMLKLHMAAAHPEFAHKVFDKGDFKKMRIKRRKGRESSSPREQKIECIYCDKSFSILKFTAHIATSGHRRNLALKKGQKTTLDTLQELAAASKSAALVKTEPQAFSPAGVDVNIPEEGSTELPTLADEHTGCVYSSAISCFRCKSQVAREKFLKEHLRVCARKIYCEVCCKLFELSRASEHHDQKCLPSIPYRCSNCGKGHVKLTALEHHVSQCKASAKFLCSQCCRCFDTFLECKVHESDEQTVYKCTECEVRFSALVELTEHETEHKENREEEKGEGKEGDDTKVDGDDTAPMKNEDEDKRKKLPYMCQTCGMGFRHKSSMEVHEYSHKDERRFMCDECGRSYKYQTSLKNHIYTHLKDEAKPHQCRFCGKRFSSAGAVKVHIRKHTGHKPYRCTVCDKTFSQLGPLKAHSRLHSGEKPLVCTFCNYDFSSHGSLSAHLKSVHKRKPFYCSNCDKGFNTESALKKHLPSHGIDAGTTVVIETVETQV